MPTGSHLRIRLILLAGALFLFLYGSGQAFRSDEVWSLHTVALPYTQMMEEIRDDIHPPLYYWMLAAWTSLVGASEVASRALSILLMLGAAAVVYFGGRGRLGERGGLLAAALFVASPLSTVAAQMVRMYGLLALVSAVSTSAYLRISAGKARRLDWALYVAANIAGSFTHVWFFFLLFAQGVAYLAFRRTLGLGRMIAAAALSLAPYAILWLPVLLQQIRKTESALAWAPPPGFSEAAQTLFLLAGLFLAAIPFLKSWWTGAGANRARAAEPALLALLAVAVPFCISQFKPVFWPRFTIVALPALSLAIAAFAPAVKKHYFEMGLVFAAAAMAIGVGFTASRCDARTTAQYLARVTRPGDVVIFTNLSRLPIDYYWDRLQPDRKIREQSFPAAIDAHPGFAGRPDHPEQEAARLVASLQDTSRVFFLHGFRPADDAPLKMLLDARLMPVTGLNLDCGSAGSYFRFISAYTCGNMTAWPSHP